MNYRTENKGISTIQKSPLRGDLEGLLGGDGVYISRLMLNIDEEKIEVDNAKVLTETVSQTQAQYQLNTAKLKNGIYFISVRTNTETFKSKFTIIK